MKHADGLVPTIHFTLFAENNAQNTMARLWRREDGHVKITGEAVSNRTPQLSDQTCNYTAQNHKRPAHLHSGVQYDVLKWGLQPYKAISS
jgi:hypothetical protein